MTLWLRQYGRPLPESNPPLAALQSCSRVIVCFRTEHYRAAAVHNVERKDVCLEVGCHSGERLPQVCH